MKNIDQFKGQKILVLGLAKSGYAAAELLHSFGAQVIVNDASPLENNEEAKVLLEQGLTVICGGHPKDLLDESFDLIVKNPGIPYSNPILQQAADMNLPIWTEIELAYRISEAPIIGITGSNGKTTTTTLLYHMLNIGGENPLIAGNIGTVACSVAKEATKEQKIVLEASSFQLMGIDQFRPKIAILTNLYEAHLDYHGDLESYQDAKAQMIKNQLADDYFIYNADQPHVVEIAEHAAAVKVPFSVEGKSRTGISADDLQIYWNGEPFIDRSVIKLPGKHNLENILCAIAAANLLGCKKSAIIDVLSSFTGVKHRMQFVKELNGRKYYNDSKATNTLATKSALTAFDGPVILLAGGLDRGHSFEELRPYMDNVKAVIALGETKERFATFARSCGVEDVKIASSMEEAVQLAQANSVEKDVILLSPASASWDEYPSFEIRGDRFITAVQALD